MKVVKYVFIALIILGASFGVYKGYKAWRGRTYGGY